MQNAFTLLPLFQLNWAIDRKRTGGFWLTWKISDWASNTHQHSSQKLSIFTATLSALYFILSINICIYTAGIKKLRRQLGSEETSCRGFSHKKGRINSDCSNFRLHSDLVNLPSGFDKFDHWVWVDRRSQLVFFCFLFACEAFTH